MIDLIDFIFFQDQNWQIMECFFLYNWRGQCGLVWVNSTNPSCCCKYSHIRAPNVYSFTTWNSPQTAVPSCVKKWKGFFYLNEGPLYSYKWSHSIFWMEKLTFHFYFFSWSGFHLQSTPVYSNGWTGSENQSLCCCESHKLRQTVPDNIYFLLNVDFQMS